MSVSAIMLINCETDSCKTIIKKAKKLRDINVSHAFRVNRVNADDADVVISLNADTEQEIMSAKDSLSEENGFIDIRIKMAQHTN